MMGHAGRLNCILITSQTDTESNSQQCPVLGFSLVSLRCGHSLLLLWHQSIFLQALCTSTYFSFTSLSRFASLSHFLFTITASDHVLDVCGLPGSLCCASSTFLWVCCGKNFNAGGLWWIGTYNIRFFVFCALTQCPQRPTLQLCPAAQAAPKTHKVRICISCTSSLSSLSLPHYCVSSASFCDLTSGPMKRIFMKEADALNFFRKRTRRGAKSQDEINGEFTLWLVQVV